MMLFSIVVLCTKQLFNYLCLPCGQHGDWIDGFHKECFFFVFSTYNWLFMKLSASPSMHREIMKTPGRTGFQCEAFLLQGNRATNCLKINTQFQQNTKLPLMTWSNITENILRWLHDGVVVNAISLEQSSPGLESQPPLLCKDGFFPSTLALLNCQETCMIGISLRENVCVFFAPCLSVLTCNRLMACTWSSSSLVTTWL